MVGDDLRVVAANRQVCPTISEISLGNLYNQLFEPNPLLCVKGARGALANRICGIRVESRFVLANRSGAPARN